ncbi:DUF2255 family protein [Streptomyces hainanensis]|uniref:DUF2255 family protein n=1 Tax=Streptomyces hainanensis TaxID=402648 RepID=A0A4V2Y374_9ACTN|nr:DUF2255 family protein [Streptomyces hainanensis]TDC75415.1 DUF2255 family protein [Streptomyces hainanensis]
MSTWTDDELSRIERADELRIAPLRRDGSPRSPIPIWVVREGDELYVRSFRGRGGAWFRTAQSRHEGHISAGGVDRDVTFVDEADPAVNERIDSAYRTKYRSYSDAYVDPMVADPARGSTLRLVPR